MQEIDNHSTSTFNYSNLVKRKMVKVFVYAIIALIFLVFYCHLESRWIKVTRIEFVSTDLPKSFSGKKIVFVTDIHHGPYFSIERVRKLVQRINELQPDLVLLGGDYVHREPKYIKPVFEELKKLHPKFGVYAVLGNHDHWEDADLTREMMVRSNFYVCDNKSYWLKIENDSIKIGGVGDLWTDKQYLNSTVNDLESNQFCILLSHNPDFLESIKTNKIDLALCGHTHGGQVSFFGIWSPIVPSKFGQKYRYGLKDLGNTKAYISSGVGTITPPLRFFCRPEIVLIELRK